MIRVNEVTLRLHFRIAAILFYIHIEIFSGPPVAGLMSRWGKVLVAARQRSALCVKRLGVPALRDGDANWQASLAVQVGVEGSLDEPSQLGAGVRVPGVRKQWKDVKVTAGLRCWSGAFL